MVIDSCLAGVNLQGFLGHTAEDDSEPPHLTPGGRLGLPAADTQELAVTLLQVKAERPQWYLAVVCGALLRVVEEASRRAAEYMGFLEKGQLPPARLTLTSFIEDLCLEGEPWFGRSSIVLLSTLPPAAFLAAVLVQVV